MKSYNDASSEAFLPGLSPSDGGAGSPVHQPTTRSGWWMRRSAEQVISAAGRPVGYRHQLMHGRSVIKSGVGPDCARTLGLQAEFMNTRDERVQRRVVTHADAASVTDSPAPPRD